MFNEQDFYNNLTLTEFFMQYLSLLYLSKDYTNRDIIAELKEQNKEYLEKIIKNQEEILRKLDKL